MRRFIRILAVFIVIAVSGLIGLRLAPSAIAEPWRSNIAAWLSQHAPMLRDLLRPPASPLPPDLSLEGALDQRLARAGFKPGDPVFIRILKRESVLELFMNDGSGFRLFRSYPICTWSGTLGPKKKEGDYQSPEGFYRVTAAAMNPNSNYHLSFNLGFPNAYDRAHGRTGSFLMVHGACASVGCYAMTDPLIDEIYGLVDAAHRAGQREVAVHALPFRLTDAALAAEQNDEAHRFWTNLADGDRLFERERMPPRVFACPGPVYRFAGKDAPEPRGCKPILGL
jgi:murein L,D-transpeptidase YafK